MCAHISFDNYIEALNRFSAIKGMLAQPGKLGLELGSREAILGELITKVLASKAAELLAEIQNPTDLTEKWSKLELCLKQRDAVAYSLAKNKDYLDYYDVLARNFIGDPSDLDDNTIGEHADIFFLNREDLTKSAFRLFRVLLHLQLAGILNIENDALSYGQFIEALNKIYDSDAFFLQDHDSMCLYRMYIMAIVYCHCDESASAHSLCPYISSIYKFRIKKLGYKAQHIIVAADTTNAFTEVIHETERIEAECERRVKEIEKKFKRHAEEIINDAKKHQLTVMALFLASFAVIITNISNFQNRLDLMQILTINISLIMVLGFVFTLLAAVTMSGRLRMPKEDAAGVPANRFRFFVPLVISILSLAFLVFLVCAFYRSDSITVGAEPYDIECISISDCPTPMPTSARRTRLASNRHRAFRTDDSMEMLPTPEDSWLPWLLELIFDFTRTIAPTAQPYRSYHVYNIPGNDVVAIRRLQQPIPHPITIRCLMHLPPLRHVTDAPCDIYQQNSYMLADDAGQGAHNYMLI